MRSCARLLAAAALAACFAAAPGAASVGCGEALTQAAARHGVPPSIMLAIGQVESGLNPLAVNSEGTPHFPADQAAAVALVEAELANGRRLIDIGCGQIDLHWHPDAFASLEAGFDAATNADYAARLMATLYRTYGDWTNAVARYHSGDPAAQQRYLAMVSQRLVGTPEAGLVVSYALAAAPLPVPSAGALTAADVAVIRGSDPAAHGVRIVRAGDGRQAATDAGPRVIRIAGR
ncbi:MAG: lytic transglycosylase domain-containing protein [Rhodospirillaceae bacterium]|nr:lytic transglycosylase domain-containing protein [Rhodospirillaceae bacterium]